MVSIPPQSSPIPSNRDFTSASFNNYRCCGIRFVYGDPLCSRLGVELAISSFTSNSDDNNPATTSTVANVAAPSNDAIERYERPAIINNGGAGPPGIAWKIITLPVSIISGSLGLVSSAIGLGFWVAGGVLSYSFGVIGLKNPRRNPESSSASLSLFEHEYGDIRVHFVPDSFMDALQRSRREFKLMFVYLHSPDHPDTPSFCEAVLCSEVLSAFLNENFVAWGGSIRASEGFKMSNSLKASRFPLCVVVMAATNKRIALLQQGCDSSVLMDPTDIMGSDKDTPPQSIFERV